MTKKNIWFFVLVALILKFFAIYYTNFDLFGDEAQYWIWSKNLDTGYYSKPPLLAWVVGLVVFLFSDNFLILKSIPVFAYVFSSYVIYLLSMELYQNKKIAFISAATFYLLPSVSVSSFLLSTDILLIFFWGLSLLYLIKIRTKPTYINFALLGILLGMAFLAKYAAIYFLLSLLLIIIFDKYLRRVWVNNITKGLIFLISLIVVVLPNLIWNIQNDWITLVHTSENAGLSRININLLQGLEFVFLQILMLGPILFLVFIFTIKKLQINFSTRLLLSFSLPVLVIVFVESVLVRANANWAAVGLVSLLLLVTNHVYICFNKSILINNFFNFAFCLMFYFLIATSSSLGFFNRINGISDFAFSVLDKNLNNIKYVVVEDRLLFSNLSYIYKDTNKIFLTPHNPDNKIKSQFHLSAPLNPSFSSNFVYLGNIGSINYLKYDNKINQIKSTKTIFKKNPINVYEVVF